MPGKLNWPDLWMPTIQLLEQPIPITQHMERALSLAKSELFKDLNARKMFFKVSFDKEIFLNF